MIAGILKSGHIGEENAIKGEELAEFLGVKEVDIRQAKFHEIIEEGELIGSSANGYFIISSKEELDKVCKTYTSRIKEMSRVIRALKKSYFRKTNKSLTS